MAIADFTISAESRQYLEAPITAATDPTADTVQFALVQIGTAPQPSDWVTGSWGTTVGSKYFPRVLVGPSSSLVLTKGYYDVYAKITDNPEQPVLHLGVLEVTA
jgi:hypothetical protein